jgi:EmrB/QacA subfamily drug resistance transporter
VSAAAPAADGTDDSTGEGLDPRRWVTLAIVIMAVIIVVIDNTVLTVALPTILEDLHTQLPSLQWVLTGYSLTFATLLVIGGRLGDIFGARRMFILGAALFAVGSFVASEAGSVPVLILGESLIEGIGASLMLPATLAIISTTFTGRERATAFAAWGATAGAAVAYGPVLGGWLTSDYSWRWCFRINLVVAPLAVLGALLFMRRTPRAERRQRIDVVGALIVAAGMFLLVFALSEGGAYGWWRALRTLTVLGHPVWSADRPLSAIPLVFVGAALLLGAFFAWERARERAGRDPLFEFGLLSNLSFRYGLLTTAVLAMGQLGFLFVLPVFLQDGQHRSALESGLWLVPSGLFIVLGAQVGARLTRRVDTVLVVRGGLILEAIGLAGIAAVIHTGLTFWQAFPSFAAFGMGLGFASSQLTNVVLSEIPAEHAGAASGANTTVRQIGAALGIAIIGSLLTTQTTSSAVAQVRSAPLPSGIKDAAATQLRSAGVGYRAPAGTAPDVVASLRHILERALADGARPALLFAAAVVVAGARLSFLIPRMGAPEGVLPGGLETVDAVEALEVLDAL